MTASSETKPKAATGRRPPLRNVALPAEHGSWGLTLEPILLGLLVDPSWRGACLGVFGFFAFLMRHPLKMAATDWRRGKRSARAILAEQVSAAYALPALAGLLAGLGRPLNMSVVVVVAVLLLLAGIQFFFDLNTRGRHPVAMLCGAIAANLLAPAILLAGHGSQVVAAAVWIILMARGVPAVRFATTQVKRAHALPASTAAPLLLQLGGLVAVVAITLMGWAPWLAVVAMVMLVARMLFFFNRPPVAARTVGWTEMLFGLLTVLLTALGYAMAL